MVQGKESYDATANAADMPECGSTGLHVDLYELTMAAGFLLAGRENEVAHFELFIRGKGPNRVPDRNYYLFAGLETVLEYIERWGFSGGDVNYLRSVPALSHLPERFFEFLREAKFTGDLFSFAEGSVVFPDEPVIRVRASITEAQMLETALLAIVNHQTTIATKASRVVWAADGRNVVEFGARRAHGLGSAAWGARAAVIGGCAATSNCYAGMRFGIPVVGTVAHSWIMSFESEEEAFDAYARAFPDGIMLLIDTYDTLGAAKLATKFGGRLLGVRLDSGDIAKLSKEVRRILDGGGCKDARIFASGDLNEKKIRTLINAGAPIDSFGVGSELITSRDQPALGGVYKLVAIEDSDGRGIDLKRKLSRGKATLPGPKQVGRKRGAGGLYAEDMIFLADEDIPGEYERQLSASISAGKIAAAHPSVAEIAARAKRELASFDAKVLSIDVPYEYPVRISTELARLAAGAETTIHRERR